MKKITLVLALFLVFLMKSYAQVQVGSGTNELQSVPFEPYYGYSYGQSIYLASEINATGNITSIQWYFSGTSLLPNSQQLVIYIGHTSKTAFASSSDFEPLTNLTTVYTGNCPVTGPGWVTLTLTTPFAYNGTSNLIVAVDENQVSWDDFGDDFYNSEVTGNRSIHAYSDSINYDPATPNVGEGNRGVAAFVPNIIFGGIQQACPTPTQLVASNITSNSANVTWFQTSTPVNGYEYFVSTSNVSPIATTTPTGITATATASVTGLTPSTINYFWTRRVCPAGLRSSWSSALAILTNCVAVNAFSQNFDASTNLPTCWAKVGTDGFFEIAASGAPGSTPNSLSFYSSSATSQSVIAMPILSNASAGTHRLKFKARGAFSGTSIVEVGYLTNIADATSFVLLQSIPLTNFTTYTNYTVEPGTTPGPSQFLAFRSAGANFSSSLIDDVLWEVIPTCGEITELVVTDITTTTASVSWTEPSVPAAVGYEYFLSTSSVAPTAAQTPTGSVGAGMNNVILNNLTSSTTYYVWVRSKCSAANVSPWSSFVLFQTLCTPAAVPTILQTVEGTTDATLPICWSATLISGTTNWTGYTPAGTFDEISTPVSGTRVFRKFYTNSDAVLFSNPLNYTGVTAPTRVSLFLQRNTSAHISDQYKIFVNTTASLTGATQILNISLLSTVAPTVPSKGFYNYTADIPASFHGQPVVYVMIQGITAGGGSSYSLGIDDFKIEVTPSCIEPTALVASNITSNTATVSWNDSATLPSNGYQYFISTTNTAPTATTVPTGSVAAPANTVNLPGLTPNTTYFIWVRSACSSSSASVWSQSATFKTSCLPITALPWTEGFETVATGTNIFPQCWGFVNILSDWSIATSPVAYAGVNSLRRTWSTEGWAFTPPVALTAGTSYTFSYFMRTNDAIVGYEIKTAVGQSQTIAAMTNELGNLTAYQGPVWTKFTYQFTPTATSSYSFGIHVTGPNPPNGINFDDFRIEITPTCVEPTALIASAITASSGTVSWTAPAVVPANGYQYFISTSNVAPNAITVPTGSTAAGVTTFNFTGLPAATLHYVWVRSNCSASDRSAWSTLVSFTTLCNAVTTFTENFDGATIPCSFIIGNGGSVSIATSGAASAPNALVMNSFSATARAMVSMPPVSNGGAGTHWLKFKARSRFSVGGVIEVGYLTNGFDPASFVSVQSFTTNSITVYNNFTAFLGTAPTANALLAFRHSGVPANEVLIDDVSWEALPACAEPTAPAASNLLANSATVSWTASASLPANGYQYFLSTTNTAPTATTAPTGSTAAGVTTVNLTGLLSTTNYFVWIRSVCSASTSSVWSPSPLTFTTPCATFTTLNQNFSTFPPACFSFAGAGTVATGPTGTSQGLWAADGFLNVGNSGAASINLYQSNNNSWMISPLMNLTSGNYTLSFNYGLTAYNATTVSAMGSDDSVKVLISINGGSSWTELTSFTAASNVQNVSALYTYAIPVASATSSVRFAILGSDGTIDNTEDYDFFIDNFKVENALSNNTFDTARFSYYPNPVKGILNIDYNQNITNVAVYNLLGQQVITKTVNANQSKIDMSNLANGSYLVKITADNQIKTIKVLKQ